MNYHTLESLEAIISIHGVPRSGTSWLGLIFDSHPVTTYRFQPLFAYRFKDQLKPSSNNEEIICFLNKLYKVDSDRFIQRGLNKDELHFYKEENPSVLVMKMVRYHHLIQTFLERSDMKIVGIVRNPCAVINSWIKSPREFDPSWDPMEEWRFAPKKNNNRPEEFNGFEKWKEVAELFLSLSEEYSKRFYLLQYERLVNNPLGQTKKLFDYLGLDYTTQTNHFLKKSQEQHDEDPYSVFKRPTVKDQWKGELDPVIQDEILNDVRNTILERFLI